MNKKLSNIFEEKNNILKVVEDFKFSEEVLIYNDMAEADNGVYRLHFIVQKIESRSYSYKTPGLLAAKLQDILKCEVFVSPYENIVDLYQQDVKNKSKSIHDENAVASLFSGTLDVPLKAIEPSEARLQEIMLLQANDYIKNNPSSAVSSAPHSSFLGKSKYPFKDPVIKKNKIELTDDYIVFTMPIGEINNNDKNCQRTRSEIVETAVETFKQELSKVIDDPKFARITKKLVE